VIPVKNGTAKISIIFEIPVKKPQKMYLKFF